MAFITDVAQLSSENSHNAEAATIQRDDQWVEDSIDHASSPRATPARAQIVSSKPFGTKEPEAAASLIAYRRAMIGYVVGDGQQNSAYYINRVTQSLAICRQTYARTVHIGATQVLPKSAAYVCIYVRCLCCSCFCCLCCCRHAHNCQLTILISACFTD